MNYNFELLFGCFTASLMKKKESIHVNCFFNGMLQTMKLGLTPQLKENKLTRLR